MRQSFLVLVLVTALGVGVFMVTQELAVAPSPDVIIDENTDNQVVIPSPTEPVLPADVASHIASKKDLIVLVEPTPLATITSPVTLKGQARGSWYFEASFPVVVTNWDGKIIGQGIATATSDWMTAEFVPFTATVTFTADPNELNQRGNLILKRDNPSGLPENDDALEIPVFLK